ncbi:MAG: sigma-70 family RNA polymerase sigma factor [Clostridiales bacterium]|nr:sigma-70 family RNA polymerase sigma factor [Clostridiales bacterium]
MKYQLQDLVDMARNGCMDAAEEILERLKPLIYSAVRRYVSGWDKDDLYQEACLTVIQCIKEFDPQKGVPFLAFVKKKVYYRLFNVSRRQRSGLSLEQTFEGQDGESRMLEELLASTEPGIEEQILLSMEKKQLYEAIDKLSPKQKQVIMMHFFQGLKYKDIARLRETHYKSVLRLKDRALSSLRKNLGHDE